MRDPASFIAAVCAIFASLGDAPSAVVPAAAPTLPVPLDNFS